MILTDISSPFKFLKIRAMLGKFGIRQKRVGVYDLISNENVGRILVIVQRAISKSRTDIA